MSAKLEALMAENNGEAAGDRRSSINIVKSYLESLSKGNKVRPNELELNTHVSENNGIPSLENFLNDKALTIPELIKYQEKYQKDDIEITHIQRKHSDNMSIIRISNNGQHSNFEGFGWITGVLIRTILCIFGATLFLRMSWIAGQAGLLLGLCIVFLSLIVVGITAISMSAIATNGEIRSGGLYYLVSRSLGPEFGGSIGVIFFLANIGYAAMNIVGLSEAIVSILADYNYKLIDGDIHDIRIYSLVICLILQSIIFIGTKFETRTQIVLMITIVISLVSHFVGTFLPNDYQRERGIVGYSPDVLWHNLWPDFRRDESFITVFGIYFPAMTGIMGGANMSGDLKTPSKSIPKGTLPAILITTLTYAMTMIITSATTVSDATGFSIPQFNNKTHDFIYPGCRWNNTCKFGINNDYELMILQGAWSPLIIAGIVATTLSSASGSMIGSPKVFQALCSDNLFPFLNFFAKGNGKNKEPYRAYFLTFFITCGIILIGRFNTIAELITNFFLAAFAIMNFACFDASAARSPGFRPGFSLYNKNLSLIGAILCIIIMFVFSWKLSLVALGIFFALYSFIKNRKSQVDWGSSTQANRYRQALSNILKLTPNNDHVKNYRPQILVLTGNPTARQVLVDFANCITKGTSLLVCGHVIPYNSSVAATSVIEKLRKRYAHWLHDHKIKAFYCAVAQTSLRSGVQNLLQTAGLGKMQPNILMLGYKDGWLNKIKEGNHSELQDYLGVINDAFESNLSICIFRNGNEGLDTSGLITDETEQFFLKLPQMTITKFSPLADDLSRGIKKKQHRPKASMMMNRGQISPIRNDNMITDVLHKFGRIPSEHMTHVNSSNSVDKKKNNQKLNINMKFRTWIKDGIVDVWWLYDDGGLTWLLAYLLTTHPSFVEDAKLRVFTTCPSNVTPEVVQDNIENLLKKFRITFKEVTVIVYEDRELYPETQDEYNEIMEVLSEDSEVPSISKEILEENASRTRRFMLQREYLLEHSSASDLVIMTLPVASTPIVMSQLYMLWLEMLSRDMPPMLFVRGNHTSVMTYYS